MRSPLHDHNNATPDTNAESNNYIIDTNLLHRPDKSDGRNSGGNRLCQRDESITINDEQDENNNNISQHITENFEERIIEQPTIIRNDVIQKDIPKGVLRKKLSKMRHLVVTKAINTFYIETLFSSYILPLFNPQTVIYNGGIANIKEWKISCYLEVMEGGIPCTNPNIELKEYCEPLLDSCNDLFTAWYKQQHACNSKSSHNENKTIKVTRLMTFITRYTPAPGEQSLLKHVDGAGKVDGSVVIALPVDRWSKPEEDNSFVGFGGGLTFWDGRGDNGRPKEIHYDMRCGDVAFIAQAVWHQANPITKGTRWALVIFYKVEK